MIYLDTLMGLVMVGGATVLTIMGMSHCLFPRQFSFQKKYLKLYVPTL